MSDLNNTVSVGCLFAAIGGLQQDAVSFDFFRQLGEPELGAVLLCESDLHVAEVGSPEVELTRTQTIMQGAGYCDFRYRLKKAAGSP